LSSRSNKKSLLWIKGFENQIQKGTLKKIFLNTAGINPRKKKGIKVIINKEPAIVKRINEINVRRKNSPAKHRIAKKTFICSSVYK
jgi:hypothetical protein